jgi:regulator of protease activity HflC (stomatin/prohibitin superfamily)
MTLILLIITIIVFALLFLSSKYKVFKYEEIGEVNDRYGNREKKLVINYKLIVSFVICILIALFQPYTYERIDAGSVGIREHLIGNERGVGSVKAASGIEFYNKYTEAIWEIAVDIKPVKYKGVHFTTKGGFPVEASPSFNCKVRPEKAIQLFIDFRQTIKTSGLNGVFNSWLSETVLGLGNDVTNRFSVDSMFNHQEYYREQIIADVNKKASSYFEITQLRPNITPPPALQESIEAKTRAVQDAQVAEQNNITAKANTETNITVARGRLEVAKLDAETNNVKSTPKLLEYYNAETMRKYADAGVSPYGNNNVLTFGDKSGPNILLNRK